MKISFPGETLEQENIHACVEEKLKLYHALMKLTTVIHRVTEM